MHTLKLMNPTFDLKIKNFCVFPATHEHTTNVLASSAFSPIFIVNEITIIYFLIFIRRTFFRQANKLFLKFFSRSN